MKRGSMKSTKKSGKASIAVTLTHNDSVQIESHLLKAMAHPVRLSMMRLLSEAHKTNRQLCANDIEKYFELSQPTISHHLKILREAKLVKTQQQGTWVYFSLYMPTVITACEIIKSLSE